MNVLGKVFLAFTIVLAIPAVYLTMLLLAHQQHWLKRIEDKQAAYEKQQEQLVAARRTVRNLEYDLARIKDTWGDTWTTEGVVANAGLGAIQVNVGANAGLIGQGGSAPASLVHLIAETPQGPDYLGEFRAAQVQANASVVQLTRQPPLPNEFGPQRGLPQTFTVRVRETVPSAWRATFDDLFAQQAMLDQKLQQEQVKLVTHDEHIRKSTAILDQRYVELNGDPTPPEGASQDVIDGLVQTVRKEEAGRDAEEQTLDDLRRDFDRKLNELRALLAGNQDRVNKLPGSVGSASPPAKEAPLAKTSAPAR
jgi:hypothetical protein